MSNILLQEKSSCSVFAESSDIIQRETSLQKLLHNENQIDFEVGPLSTGASISLLSSKCNPSVDNIQTQMKNPQVQMLMVSTFAESQQGPRTIHTPAVTLETTDLGEKFYCGSVDKDDKKMLQLDSLDSLPIKRVCSLEQVHETSAAKESPQIDESDSDYVPSHDSVSSSDAEDNDEKMLSNEGVYVEKGTALDTMSSQFEQPEQSKESWQSPCSESSSDDDFSDSSDSDMDPEDPLVCLLPPLPPDLVVDYAEEAESIPRGHGYEGVKLSKAFVMRVEAETTNVEQLLSDMRSDPKVRSNNCILFS